MHIEINNENFNHRFSSLHTQEEARKSYDFIIAGAGCAGLSLAMHMIASGAFREKQILLIDKDAKQTNDRTWCFWQKEEGLFESVVYHKWEELLFYEDHFSGKLDIAPYTYKMIRGIDFYQHCLSIIKQQSNFTFCFGNVNSIKNEADKVIVNAGGETFSAGYVFNSILFQKPVLKPKQHWLLQHFKGWIIETERAHFHPLQATLMDFRINQSKGTAFCYVLPFTTNKALIEYTLFSPSVLHNEDYDAGLHHYVEQLLDIDTYSIVETEFGVIPMTNYSFPTGEGRVINIGTAGGQTKGSSGYTFNFIQKHSKALVDAFSKSEKPEATLFGRRFHFYDSVLLHILQNKTLPGKEIFSDLFKHNSAAQVLKFLDNETTLAEEVKIISTLPAWPFMKAALQQVF